MAEKPPTLRESLDNKAMLPNGTTVAEKPLFPTTPSAATAANDDDSVSSDGSDWSESSQSTRFPSIRVKGSRKSKKSSKAAQVAQSFLSPQKDCALHHVLTGAPIPSIGLPSIGHSRTPSDSTMNLSSRKPTNSSSLLSSRANSILSASSTPSRRMSFDVPVGLNKSQPGSVNGLLRQDSAAEPVGGLVPTTVHHIQITPEVATGKDNPLKGYRRQTLNAIPSRRTSIELNATLVTAPSLSSIGGANATSSSNLARRASRSSFAGEGDYEDKPVNKAVQRLTKSGITNEVVDSIQALLDSQVLKNGPRHTKQTVHSMINTVHSKGLTETLHSGV